MSLSKEEIEEFRTKASEFKVQAWDTRDAILAEASTALLQHSLMTLCDMALRSIQVERELTKAIEDAETWKQIAKSHGWYDMMAGGATSP